MNEEELKTALIKEIEWKAHRVIEEYRKCVENLQSLEREKETILYQIDKYDIPRKRWEISYIYKKSKEKEDKLQEYIQQAVDHISMAYEKGKYEGRDMAGLFRGIFGMISEEAKAKLEAKI